MEIQSITTDMRPEMGADMILGRLQVPMDVFKFSIKNKILMESLSLSKTVQHAQILVNDIDIAIFKFFSKLHTGVNIYLR